MKKVVFKNFAIFTGKHLCWSLLFEEHLQAAVLGKNRGIASCFK